MKVLYQFTDPIVNDQEGFAFRDPAAASRKLKCIDYLIDMQVNVTKINHNTVLSDDGRVFYLDSEPFFDLDSQSALLNQSHMSQPNPAEGGRVLL